MYSQSTRVIKWNFIREIFRRVNLKHKNRVVLPIERTTIKILDVYLGLYIQRKISGRM